MNPHTTIYKTKNPRILTFYLLPKIHKKDNPGRPVVNGIGSVTEKISAYVDTFLRNIYSKNSKLHQRHHPLPEYIETSKDSKHRLIGHHRCQIPVHQHTSNRRHSSHYKDDRRHRIRHPTQNVYLQSYTPSIDKK